MHEPNDCELRDYHDEEMERREDDAIYHRQRTPEDAGPEIDEGPACARCTDPAGTETCGACGEPWCAVCQSVRGRLCPSCEEDES